jgi:hypothetical protein
MSLAAQCSLGHSPTESFQVDVVGDMLAKFQEQEERCLRLKNSGMRVCNLILGSSDDQVWPTNHLEEAIGQFLVMQEEQGRQSLNWRPCGALPLRSGIWC